MILTNSCKSVYLNGPKIKWKVILIGIVVIVTLTTTCSNIYGIITTFPTHCDIAGYPSCYSVGFDAGKANPGTSCPSGHSAKFCNGWNDGANAGRNNDNNSRNQNSSKNGGSTPLSQTNASPHFDTKDFKIITFGVKNHNPFVVVQGKAGGSRGDESGYNEFGYIFYTDKGLFGAFSAFPDQPYPSSHFTQKNINGFTCLDKAQKAGRVLISGPTLTITGIHINRVDKALTELSFVDSDNGNCINTIYSSKP